MADAAFDNMVPGRRSVLQTVAPTGNRRETKPDGTPYLSGTEWEFEDALAANKPVFVYRRTGSVPLNPADPEFDEKVTWSFRT